VRRRYAFFLLVGASASLQADVNLNSLFQDGAVLQHGKPVPVWGTADPAEPVSVSFGGQTVSTRADSEGHWMVTLEALSPSSRGTVLTVKGNNRLDLQDILVGEVWLASGQSNMAWSVAQSRDAAVEIATARFPQIREFNVARKVSEMPLREVEGSWTAASPETVGNFSAVAYFFARDLHQTLEIPVGIIRSAWGGTRIESWLPPQAAAAENGPVQANIHTRWKQTLADYPAAQAKRQQELAEWTRERDAAQAAGKPFTRKIPRLPDGPGHHSTPTGLYQAMIAPLVPYALGGIIWYQGESNAGRAGEYHVLFSALITSWREAFGQGNLPFFWVQLANYQSPTATHWAFLREAQTRTLGLPATGQAVTIDIGDVTDIHPRNKQDVGRRLARLAFNRVYGLPMADSGPLFERAEREGNGFRVHFTDTQAGLKTPSGFELAGGDKVFHPAVAKVEGKTVVLTSDKVSDPVAVRYAWRNPPQAGLFNSEDLPAVPFRTDDW
jgi:sialate O-acetylesterase